MASATSSLAISICLGRPLTRLRPAMGRATALSPVGKTVPRAHQRSSSRPEADEQVVAEAHIADDGIGKGVPRDVQDVAGAHLAGRDHRDVGGGAADIRHHAAVVLADIHACAQGGRQGPFHQLGAAGARLEHAHDQLPLLDLVGRGGEGQDRPGPGEDVAADDAGYKMVEHDGQHVEILDAALLQGTDHLDVAGLPPQHPVRLGANGDDVVRFMIHRQHRRLIEHDAPAPRVDQHIGRA